jgi:hypothetical protein
MNHHRVREGGCACGAVRYSVQGQPRIVGICHCTTCRKETGSAFSSYADWPASSFQYRGEIKTYNGRSFCPACGSRLFNLSDNTVSVRIGSLDEAPTTDIAPIEEIWVKRREHWLLPLQLVPQYQEDPIR